jgi:hypothetical protein
MYCREGFTAEGEVDLLGAHIGAQLIFDGADLANPDGAALHADGLRVDQDLICHEGFTANGEVRLPGARVGDQLVFNDATLINPDGTALDLEGARASSLFLRFSEPPRGTVDLSNASVDTCYDSQATWPADLRLDGFRYEAVVADPAVDVTTRLRWLDRDPGGYLPQLYEQLTAAYRKAGRDDDARKVAIAKQRRRRQALNLPGRWWNSLLRWSIGYGYRTWQAGMWLLGFLAVGWIVFARAYPAHMTPTTPGEPLPTFQPLVYALDTLLPVVDLHQQEHWIPRGAAQWWAWACILAGWLLTTAVLAALTGLIKRD